MEESVSHYRLLQRLGAGAMGEVYLAEDTRLGRRVALKFLAAPMASDEAAKTRFVREARAASLLDHPNICTVHDIEETADGRILLAMAYCDGESLRARIDRAREAGRAAGAPWLPLDEVLDIACQVAEGLAEAHAGGIVHRDIKPANIMLTRAGRVKIVDFGLAHMSDITVSAVTVVGTVMGTPAYMAPEQVRGEAVDARADIWSFGVVLHEMLTGQLPFQGDSAVARFFHILNAAPEPVARLRADLPGALPGIVSKALEKDREARYQRAADLLADLRACARGGAERAAGSGAMRSPDGQPAPGLAAPDPANGPAGTRATSEHGASAVPLQSPAATPVALAAGPSLPSVAVLPFVNLSGDKDQEYFCDGIAEELINALGTVGGLRVTSFTSSLRFKARAVDIREIGAHLRVGTVLEGTLRKAGSRVRLTAQLVDAADGYQLWSDRYDRELDDVFALQDEIARGIVERLKVRLLGDRAAPIVRPATPNVEAHDLYLQGRHHFGRRYKGAVGRAVECFEKALALDPRFAAACAGLADCYAVMALWGDRPAGELRGLARGIIERARSLDASLAEVHHAIGMVRLYLDWDWPALESAFEEALRINPGLAYTRACFAAGLTVAGDRARAEAQAEQALALDPLSPLVITLAAGAWGGFGSHDRAVRLLERALELDAEFTPALVNLAQTLSAMGRDADAMAAASRAVGIAGRRPHFLSVLGAVLASAGQTDESRAILSEIEDIARSEYVSPMESITVLAALGDADRVFEALDRAAGDRLPPYPFLFLLPAYDRLRRDPRFAPVLARFNYHGTWLTEAGATRTGFRR